MELNPENFRAALEYNARPRGERSDGDGLSYLEYMLVLTEGGPDLHIFRFPTEEAVRRGVGGFFDAASFDDHFRLPGRFDELIVPLMRYYGKSLEEIWGEVDGA